MRLVQFISLQLHQLQRSARLYAEALAESRSKAAAAAAVLEAESAGAEAAAEARALRLQAARVDEQVRLKRSGLKQHHHTGAPLVSTQLAIRVYNHMPCGVYFLPLQMCRQTKSMQVRVLKARLATAQKLEADAAAAQEESALLADGLAAKKAQLASAAQQAILLQSLADTPAGGEQDARSRW